MDSGCWIEAGHIIDTGAINGRFHIKSLNDFSSELNNVFFLVSQFPDFGIFL